MKKLIAILLTLMVAFTFLTGCMAEDATNREQEQTEQIMTQIMDEVGMPNITNFYEKKMAKEIYELRDDSELVCYAYQKNEMSGKLVYVGKCMGYGLPYSTQYTQPERIDVQYFGGVVGHVSGTVPQADPNGLYSPDGVAATWLMMIDEVTGDRYVMYCEPNIIVTQNKLPTRLIEEWSIPANY